MNSSNKTTTKCECSSIADFECYCKAQIQYFCSDCASIHMKEPNLLHKLQTISISINESSRSALINFIKDSLHNLNKINTSISAQMHKIFLTLQEHAKASFKGISKLKKNLNSLLYTLKFSPQNICEWNIKKILAQDVQKTIEDLTTWELFSVSFNIEMFEIPWVIFDNNYEKYIMLPKKSEFKHEIKSKSCTIEIENMLNEENRLEFIKKSEKTELVLYCENNHKLTWSYIVPLEYFLLRGNSLVRCHFCGKEFCKSCWHCSQCAFDVCEDCGISQGFACPKLVCDKGHELLWKCTVAENYRNLCGIASWNCDCCKMSKSKASWHCDLCKYDLCQKCARKSQVLPIKLKDKCILNHNLKQEMYLGNFKCKDCSEKIIDLRYSCHNCNYHICRKCIKNHNLDIPQYPILTCFNDHLLRWNSQIFFICNACEKNKQSSFNCINCNFNYCYECADYLEDIIRMDIIRYDNNGHQLKIFFTIEVESNMCLNYCKTCNMKFIKNTLVFSCETCLVYICINCHKNNRKISQMQEEF
ncbi:hypothetical protein SteCoe_28496 [Stentor coeruleus]|uniref:Uncharacterized protein n=1 Tax=Stentor coeruleus TaxID=5963 RepID=A0A1R2B8L6_9CILI|nr:hypothetical protein SteCoe_28496 [Stentor coeruleus]